MKFSISGPTEPMVTIRVYKSPAQTPGTPIDKSVLEHATKLHVDDVGAIIDFMIQRLTKIKEMHDHTKFEKMDDLLRGYNTGFKDDIFWNYHKTQERHHLDPSVKDVDLLDILENIVDGVAAGMARKGEVYPFKFSPELLTLAVANTAKLIEKHVQIVAPPPTP
jgi:hypothetical protein